MAHVVPFKGSGDGWIARHFARDVQKFGCHGRIAVRIDGEVAIKDLRRVLARAPGNLLTALENPPPTDWKANRFCCGTLH